MPLTVPVHRDARGLTSDEYVDVGPIPTAPMNA
jgi:hypothetical protein